MAATVLLSIALMVCKVIPLAPLPGVKEYDVVYPQKLYSRDTEAKYPDEIQYRFHIKGEDVLLQLEKNKNLFTPNYSQTHYLPSGQEVTVTPSMLDHCYYHGYLRNDSNSEASISLCNGLSGYFMNRGQQYLIAPLNLTNNEHAVYKYSNLESTLKTCEVTDTALEVSPAETFRYWTPTQVETFFKAKKYVEVYIVADTTVYKKYYQSEDAVRMKIFEVINYVNLNVVNHREVSR
ncbi:hypothetical protein NDU88_004117 [Pleurodeles waltl]|uniref:Uncharacterized protein n=1 Tax=Pleurodeles waltl TaxID=8319 RepID=A0AAV7LKE7_PLEWA|nr:hypothetical protein NDU88_004117 [Pleurodeles waltl]